MIYKANGYLYEFEAFWNVKSDMKYPFIMLVINVYILGIVTVTVKYNWFEQELPDDHKQCSHEYHNWGI